MKTEPCLLVEVHCREKCTVPATLEVEYQDKENFGLSRSMGSRVGAGVPGPKHVQVIPGGQCSPGWCPQQLPHCQGQLSRCQFFFGVYIYIYIFFFGWNPGVSDAQENKS
ncbi:hypothetical protein RchiOBHm_Chr7g0232441 [Rosa chinensis]|uniref:Uncharacterized protein n=1 Tax=Rosa chinensis TaxID=74649 RepID=A0A2P6PFX5_ROSCH|nr:hypothetical protein RchiOBHm_Chr7g0232441 [Rosa chinensis]